MRGTNYIKPILGDLCVGVRLRLISQRENQTTTYRLLQSRGGCCFTHLFNISISLNLPFPLNCTSVAKRAGWYKDCIVAPILNLGLFSIQRNHKDLLKAKSGDWWKWEDTESSFSQIQCYSLASYGTECISISAMIVDTMLMIQQKCR